MNPEEEEELAIWVRKRWQQLDSTTFEEIIEQAYLMAKFRVRTNLLLINEYFIWKRSEPNPPTHGWLTGFIKRKNLKSRNAEALEKVRRTECTAETVSKWFKETIIPLKIDKVPSSLLFNMDETFIETSTKLRVVVPKEAKKAVVEDPGKGEHITAAFCISADGVSMRPYVIYPLQNLPPSILSFVENDKIYVGGSGSGWMNVKLFTAWVKHFISFVNEVREKKSLNGEKAILFIDGHNSRGITIIE